ncbi:MAG: transposase [Candidatus Delongbacteria bacterium]|nr:transposase [Candidatus Delongbacteria bacterium]
MHALLSREGIRISEKVVRRIMHEANLVVVRNQDVSIIRIKGKTALQQLI